MSRGTPPDATFVADDHRAFAVMNTLRVCVHDTVAAGAPMR